MRFKQSYKGVLCGTLASALLICASLPTLAQAQVGPETVSVQSASDWLLAAAPKSYTIQLATIYGYQNCRSLQSQYTEQSIVCFESSTVANRYFAVTGVYTSRSSAQQAAGRMGIDNPWINYLPRILETRCEMSDRDQHFDALCQNQEEAQASVKTEVETDDSTFQTVAVPANEVATKQQQAALDSNAVGEDKTLDAQPLASDEPAKTQAGNGCLAQRSAAATPRRRPNYPVLVYESDPCDPNRLARPKAGLLPDPAPVPDRWRIVDTLGYAENLWDPYNNNNPIKGDKPVFGKDWFFNLSIISDTVVEPRRFPLPVGAATTADAGQLDLVADGDQYLLNENLIVETVLYRGDTVFRPPDHEFRLITVLNLNHTVADEVGVLKADPAEGDTRTEGYVGIQGAFWDYHIRNVSDRYDFDSFRIGIQPFSTDFRGFLFQDNQFGVRLFGTRKNNIFQYNLAWFRRLEKESNSGLNDITDDLREDDTFIANLYWQDFPSKGFVSQASVIHNRNREADDFFFDDNQFIARPSSLGLSGAETMMLLIWG